MLMDSMMLADRRQLVIMNKLDCLVWRCCQLVIQYYNHAEWGDYLTNRFHVAVRLFSNRSQMTSKCAKMKKSGTPGVAECVTDVLNTFWRLLWSITESDARQPGIYLFYIITKRLFYFKVFLHNAKAGLLPCLCTTKSHLMWSMIHTKWSNFIGCYA